MSYIQDKKIDLAIINNKYVSKIYVGDNLVYKKLFWKKLLIQKSIQFL